MEILTFPQNSQSSLPFPCFFLEEGADFAAALDKYSLNLGDSNEDFFFVPVARGATLPFSFPANLIFIA